MANGNLDFSTIYGGLTGGGENLSSIVNSLVQTLQQGAYFGSSYDEQGEYQSLEDMGAGVWAGGGAGEDFGWQGYGSEGYNLENLISGLEGQFGEEGTYSGSLSTDAQGGMTHLLELLKSLSSSGISGEYGQGAGDIYSETGSQYNLLKEKLIGKGKGTRYGTLATGGRQRGPGGKSQYLRDYYGLKGKESEMLTGLQEDLTGGYEDEILQYMQYFPS